MNDSLFLTWWILVKSRTKDRLAVGVGVVERVGAVAETAEKQEIVE